MFVNKTAFTALTRGLSQFYWPDSLNRCKYVVSIYLTNVQFYSLVLAHEALITFEILGLRKDLNVRNSTCSSAVDTLGSSTSSLNDLFTHKGLMRF